VKSEMGEGDLIGRGFEREFFGGHGIGGRRHVFRGAGEAGAQGVADRIGGGRSRRGLGESYERSARECGENGEFADHGWRREGNWK